MNNNDEIEFVDKIEDFLKGFLKIIERILFTIKEISFCPKNVFSIETLNKRSSYVKPFTFIAITTFSYIKIIRVALVYLLIFLSLNIECGTSRILKETTQDVTFPDFSSFLNLPSLVDFIITSLPMLMIILIFSSMILLLFHNKKDSPNKSQILEASCYAVAFQHVILIVLSAILITSVLLGNYVFSYLILIALSLSIVLVMLMQITSFKLWSMKSNKTKILLITNLVKRILFGLLIIMSVAITIYPIVKYVGEVILQFEVFYIYLLNGAITISIIWPLYVFVTFINAMSEEHQPKTKSLIILLSLVLILSSLFWCCFISYQLAKIDVGDKDKRRPYLNVAEINVSKDDIKNYSSTLLITNNQDENLNLLKDGVFYSEKVSKFNNKFYTGVCRNTSVDSMLLVTIEPGESVPLLIDFKIDTTMTGPVELSGSSIGLIGFDVLYSDGYKQKVYSNVYRHRQ